LPLYLVIFVGVVSCSLMITVFGPMIMRGGAGMLAALMGLSLVGWSR